MANVAEISDEDFDLDVLMRRIRNEVEKRGSKDARTKPIPAAPEGDRVADEALRDALQLGRVEESASPFEPKDRYGVHDFLPYHDEEFLRANLKEEERDLTPAGFIGQITESLGQPRWVGELRGVFRTRLEARHLAITGLFQFPALFESTTPVWINLQVSRVGDSWQIDHVGWEYSPKQFPRGR